MEQYYIIKNLLPDGKSVYLDINDDEEIYWSSSSEFSLAFNTEQDALDYIRKSPFFNNTGIIVEENEHSFDNSLNLL